MSNSDLINEAYDEACTEACEFADGFDTPQDAWDASARGDWMLFALGIQSGEAYGDGRRSLVNLVAQVAKLSIHLSAHASKATEAIDYAQAWGFGDPTKTEDDIDAYMEAMKEAEVDDVEDVFLVPLYVVTHDDNAELAHDMGRMAAVYAGSNTDMSWGALTQDDEKYAEIADLVREHFPEAPTSVLGAV